MCEEWWSIGSIFIENAKYPYAPSEVAHALLFQIHAPNEMAPRVKVTPTHHINGDNSQNLYACAIIDDT